MKEYIIEFGSVLCNEETGEVAFNPKVKGELVRCKDCKQCRKTILFGHFATVCDYWIKLTDDDGYCNHAERKE